MPRRGARRLVQLPCGVSLLDAKKNAAGYAAHHASVLSGYTRDLGESGLTLITPIIRLGERYLTDTDSIMRITLELPTGLVCLHAVSVRFEQIAEDDEETGYLIGANITEMSNSDRARYAEYLASLSGRERRSHKNGQNRVEPASPMGKNTRPAVTSAETVRHSLTPAQVSEAFEAFEKSLQQGQQPPP